MRKISQSKNNNLLQSMCPEDGAIIPSVYQVWYKDLPVISRVKGRVKIEEYDSDESSGQFVAVFGNFVK
ncbi:MAG: hypothetical protein GY816_11390 [Cytophagales bacterium]|nr:hypothetical protein [Cytophagales bacterium]